jgi:RecB family endonuclease NucS
VPPLRESALRRILARDLSLVEPGLKPFDPERGAEEYSVEVGRMDLFCRDKDDNPVVIELKKDDACDAVVGQLARYMGYVGEHHLPPGGRVRGIIISHDADETLRYAIKAVAGAELLTYEVEVRVHKFQTAS